MTILRLSESQEQIVFVDHVLNTYRNDPTFVRPLFRSTQSGTWIAGSGTRKAALIAKYKREGWVNGVADILYQQPRGPFPFLAIEMKTPARRGEKNGGLSDAQMEWLDAARSVGACVFVAYGADEAIGAFAGYMMEAK